MIKFHIKTLHSSIYKQRLPISRLSYMNGPPSCLLAGKRPGSSRPTRAHIIRITAHTKKHVIHQQRLTAVTAYIRRQSVRSR